MMECSIEIRKGLKLNRRVNGWLSRGWIWFGCVFGTTQVRAFEAPGWRYFQKRNGGIRWALAS